MDEPFFDRLALAYAKTVRILDPIRFTLYSSRGLTMAQAKVLFMLAQRPGATAGELAEELKVAPPTVTGMTDRLLKQGLIERREDPRDRRVVRLALSEEGTKLTSEVTERSKARLREVFSRMTDERLEQLAELLEELTAVEPSSLWTKEAAPSQA